MHATDRDGNTVSADIADVDRHEAFLAELAELQSLRAQLEQCLEDAQALALKCEAIRLRLQAAGCKTAPVRLS